MDRSKLKGALLPLVLGLQIGLACYSIAAADPISGGKKSGQAPSPADKSTLDRMVKDVNDLSFQTVNDAQFGALPQEKIVSPFLVKAEILLDRAHASPGVIDGLAGDNLEKAIAVFETTHGLPADGKLTDKVWALLTEDGASVLTEYEITVEDVAGPYTPNIPADYSEQAKLPALGYRNETEMFAERFHMDQALLTRLNPDVDMTKTGTKIIVAEVNRPALTDKIDHIDVDKDTGQVRAYDEGGKLIVAYPASVGSDDLPSPSGTHTVKGVARHPVYSYNPQKNFQQGNNTKPLTLPAGPNNPVGIVYIALSKPTYGIHGTPDPSKIDKTNSHGCVRLTNWDAQELAGMVRPGLTVHFLESKD